MTCWVHFLGEWTKVPRIHNITSNLNGLDIFYFCYFFVFPNRSIIHSHFTCVLRFVKFNYLFLRNTTKMNSRCLLHCHTRYFILFLCADTFIIQCTMLSTILSRSTLYRIKWWIESYFLTIQFIGKNIHRRHPTIHTSIHLHVQFTSTKNHMTKMNIISVLKSICLVYFDF